EAHVPAVNFLSLEAAHELESARLVPNSPDHRHARAESRCSHCLVCPLAPRPRVEGAAEHRLPRPRQRLAANHEVRVDPAEDNHVELARAHLETIIPAWMPVA